MNGAYLRIEMPNVTVADVTLREAYKHPIHEMTTDARNPLNTRIYMVTGCHSISIMPTDLLLYLPMNRKRLFYFA